MYEGIRDVLVKMYGFDDLMKLDSYDMLYAENELIIVHVIPPIKNDYHITSKWQVSFSTVAAFDKWWNSEAICRYFDSEEEVVKYLVENQANIYRELLAYLSKEYNNEFRENEDN